MNIKELYIRIFKKSQAVIILRVNESGRITTHWAIPHPDNIVKLVDVDDAITLHKSARFLSTKRNIPTYLVNYGDSQPIDLTDVAREGHYSIQELRLILDSDLAQKAFKAGNTSKISDEAKIIIIIILVGFLALGYYLNMQITKLAPPPGPVYEEVIVNG